MRFEAKQGDEGLVSFINSNIYSSFEKLKPVKNLISSSQENLAIEKLPRNIRLSSEMKFS